MNRFGIRIALKESESKIFGIEIKKNNRNRSRLTPKFIKNCLIHIPSRSQNKLKLK